MAELSFKRRVFYGMGGLTMNLPDLIIMQWLLVRYVPPTGTHLVAAKLFGIIFFLGRVADAVGCAVISHWSDGVDTRWGRRVPLMRFGIVPFALVFFLLYNPPVDHMHWLNAAYTLVLIPCYFLLYGVIIIPYLALMPEITSDLKERVDLTTFQSLFIMFTTILFTFAGAVIEKWGWLALSGGAAILLTLFFIPVSTQIPEKRRAAAPGLERLGLAESLWLAIKNRPCRYVIMATSCYWFCLNGIIALLPHWTVSYLGKSDQDVTSLMIPFVAVNLIFFFVFNYLAGKLGKYVMMLVTFLSTGLVLLALASVGHLPFGSEFLQTAVVVALFGAPVAGFMVLPFAVLGDVVDYDEQLTGRRREGVFFGVQGIFQKLMIGVSILTFTIVPYLGTDGSQRLTTEKAIRFSGVYRPQVPSPDALDSRATTQPNAEPGTVQVTVSPVDLAAPWRLHGPDGSLRQGKGNETIAGLKPGAYRIEWADVPGWESPEPLRTPTPRGLKTMVLLCAIAAIAAFLTFLGYPIRERGGKAVVIR